VGKYEENVEKATGRKKNGALRVFLGVENLF
jgi:hypothetical protein